jgi:hypothetical protein
MRDGVTPSIIMNDHRGRASPTSACACKCAHLLLLPVLLHIHMLLFSNETLQRACGVCDGEVVTLYPCMLLHRQHCLLGHAELG